MPSFSGISVALQSLLTHQQAIDVINHNVSNANTPGYHRQEVILSAGPTQGPPGYINSTIMSQIGTGVVLDQIKRYNESFTDYRYRVETGESSRWTLENNVLKQVESMEAETSVDGLSKKLDAFWAGWKAVSTDPEDTALRANLLEAGKAVAKAFNTRFESLTQIQKDLDNTVVQNVQEINTLATQIAQLNTEIGRYRTPSTQPNDFLDKQANYLDRLTQIAGAKITYENNGQVMVSIGGHMIVQGSNTHQLITTVDTANNNFRNVQWADGQPFNPTSGEMVGIFDARDTIISGEKTKLNNLAATVFTSVNALHQTGYGLDDTVPSATSGSSPVGYPPYPYSSGSANPMGRDFFVVQGDPGWSSGWTSSGSMSVSGSYVPPSMINIAQTISINTDLENVRNIAAAQAPQVSGDGRLAEALFLLQTNKTAMKQVNNSYIPGGAGSPVTNLLDPVSGNPVTDNINKYNTQRVTEMGLTIQHSDTMASQHKNLLDVLNKDRESVNGVSLDEEAANLIKYQRSYQASIRMMTAVDDMLDRVINNMGSVGR
jgi:flagellar hook-associated protein 1